MVKSSFRLGDMVMTVKDLVSRSDGFIFGNDEGKEKHPYDWFKGAVPIEKGTYFLFLGVDEENGDGKRGLIKKMPMGETRSIEVIDIELVSQLD